MLKPRPAWAEGLVMDEAPVVAPLNGDYLFHELGTPSRDHLQHFVLRRWANFLEIPLPPDQSSAISRDNPGNYMTGGWVWPGGSITTFKEMQSEIDSRIKTSGLDRDLINRFLFESWSVTGWTPERYEGWAQLPFAERMKMFESKES